MNDWLGNQINYQYGNNERKVKGKEGKEKSKKEKQIEGVV